MTNLRRFLATWVLLVGFFVSAKVEGGMTVSLVTGDNPIKARAFIIDPQGRRFGRDPLTGVSYYEVPNTGYDLSSIAADDGSGEATPEAEVFYLEPAEPGAYIISVYALAPSTYTLIVGSSDNDHNPYPTVKTSGSLPLEGRISTYHFSVNPTAGAPVPTLVKVETNDDPVLPLLACVDKKDDKGRWSGRHGRHEFRGHRRRHAFKRKNGTKDKDYVAVFGYENRNAEAVEIPVGLDNAFSPAPQDRGQTEAFEPGVVKEAFEVPFGKKEVLNWTLKGPDGQTKTVTADHRSPTCR